jgi:hypothetical protein
MRLESSAGGGAAPRPKWAVKPTETCGRVKLLAVEHAVATTTPQRSPLATASSTAIVKSTRRAQHPRAQRPT